ncbi:MAG: SagB family peptide dehydrogenase [Spirochaetota bacterium]
MSESKDIIETNMQASNIFFSVRLRDDIIADRPGNGRIIFIKNGIKCTDIPADHPLIESLIAKWVTEATIDQEASSASNPSVIYYIFEKLFSLGLLKARCTLNEKSLFSVVPAPEWQAWQGKLPASAHRLSPCLCLRQNEHDFILEMPLSQKKCIIHDGRCIIWLMEIVQGSISMPVNDAARSAFYLALWMMNALICDEDSDPSWEFHDLLFFHHSSIGFHDDATGATCRFKDKSLPEPLLKAITGFCVSLPEPDERLMKKLNTPFAEVLAKRRSSRNVCGSPALEEIGALLFASARIQSVRDDSTHSYFVSLRPSPSGGALHSIEIYLFVRQCTNLESGVWRYDPGRHQVESVAADNELFEAYMNSNPYAAGPNTAPPYLRLVMTSRFQRNSWKYEKIAYRLVLQDLGCLYQTISLAAAALGLATCILGAVEAKRLGEIMKLEPLIEPVIGEMMLSS